MRHCIGRGVIGPWPFVGISEDYFARLKTAKHNVFVLLGIEEKFGMIVDNYLEYEGDLLKLALDHMAWHSADWPTMRDAMSLLNRRLANLLTVSRLYVDQVKQDVAQMYGAPEAHRMCQEFNVQYDRLLGYRVMEALRNFIQHRSLPIARLDYPAAWEPRKEGQLLHHRACAHLGIAALRDDRNFKASVLQELEKGGNETQDITPWVRQYIDGLASVHRQLRTLTKVDVELWKKILLEALHNYELACGEDPGAVVAFCLGEEDVTVEEIPIFREGIDRLDRWRASLPPTMVSQWYVSNENM